MIHLLIGVTSLLITGKGAHLAPKIHQNSRDCHTNSVCEIHVPCKIITKTGGWLSFYTEQKYKHILSKTAQDKTFMTNRDIWWRKTWRKLPFPMPHIIHVHVRKKIKALSTRPTCPFLVPSLPHLPKCWIIPKEVTWNRCFFFVETADPPKPWWKSVEVNTEWPNLRHDGGFSTYFWNNRRVIGKHWVKFKSKWQK